MKIVVHKTVVIRFVFFKGFMIESVVAQLSVVYLI